MAIIVIGATAAAVLYLQKIALRAGRVESYEMARHRMARAIIFGLEVLIAGDIIRTVALSPTLQNIGVLALIVLVRTFLAFTLQVEVEGRWPWQDAKPGTVPQSEKL